MKSIRRSVFLLFLLVSIQSQAFSFFAGTGDAYAWPKILRVTFGSVELGYYPNSLGVTKVFEKGNYYAHFGAGISGAGSTDSGFIAGVGYHIIFLKFMGFKADWSSFAGVKSYMSNQVSIGFTVNF